MPRQYDLLQVGAFTTTPFAGNPCAVIPDASRKKRPADVNALAASIVDDATADEPEAPTDDGKDPAAVELGRRGGLKGGPARAKKLSKKRRSEAAKLAASARWKKSDR